MMIGRKCERCERFVPVAPGVRWLLVAHVGTSFSRQPCGNYRTKFMHLAYAIEHQHKVMQDDALWDLP